jgi:uncharacterized membrane protein
MSKIFKVFILFSVILNIVLIGIVGGYTYRKFFTNKPKYNLERMNKFIDSTSLSLGEQNEFKKEFRESIPPRFNDIKNYKAELDQIMAAEQFDTKKFKANLEQHQNSSDIRKKAMANFIISLASQLNQEERKNLTTILKKRGRHSKHKRN